MSEPVHSAAHAGINWLELTAAAVNFGLLMFAYYLLARKGVRSYLQNRRKSFEDVVAAASEAKRKAEQERQQLEQRLAGLEAELDKLRGEIVHTGVVQREQIVAESKARAERMRREAQRTIDQQIKQLRLDLKREAVDAAIDAAEAVLRERLTNDDRRRIAQAFVAALEPEARKQEAA